MEGQTEHVLCLYYCDDSRKHELRERNDHEYGVKYRYWKRTPIHELESTVTNF
jgi:hypothetical protein